MSLHPAVAEILELRRRGRLEASRHSFTVARGAALLRLREMMEARVEAQGGELWLWTLTLVRAANAASEAAHVSVRVEADPNDEALEAVIFEILTPGFDCRELDTRDLLAGALEPDLGAPLAAEGSDEEARAARVARVQALLGRAVNEALAAGPRALVVQTPAPGGGRRFEPREQVVEGSDPYKDRRLQPAEGEHRLVVEFSRSRAGIGTRLGRWVRGRSSTQAVVHELWAARLLDERGDAVDPRSELESDERGLGRIVIERLAAPAIVLGHHARVGPRARLAEAPSAAPRNWTGQWLVRDGVRLVELSTSLGETGLGAALGPSWIDCPSLRLTADEGSVVRDGAFELLVAWLHDYLARRREDGSVVWPTQPFVEGQAASESEGQAQAKAEESQGSQGSQGSGAAAGASPEEEASPEEDLPSERVGAPLEDAKDTRPGLRSANDWIVPRAFIEGENRRGREMLYTWRHRVGEVPAHARSKILAPWPAEMALIRAQFPDLRLVPVQALSGPRDAEPVDLTALRGDSFAPLVLARAAPAPLSPGSEAKLGALCVTVEAYVHRSPAATSGFLVLLAYERRIAQLNDSDHALPGLTIMGRVSRQTRPGEAEGELDMAGLRRDGPAVTALAGVCRDRTIEHWEPLLSHVVGQANPWETPLVRSALARLEPVGLELRYRPTAEGLRLSWRDTALLEVELGKDGAGATVRLRDALVLLRERGVIVVGDQRRRPGLLSGDPRLHPWKLVGVQRELAARVLGRAALLPMPTTPEAYPLVQPTAAGLVEGQRHLVSPAHVSADLSRAHREPRARERLLGLLLVARSLGHDTGGLEDRPLLERYDSRAASPTRLLSLNQALAEVPRLGLVPTGAVHRGLTRPVIEAPPGLAALLAHVAGFEAAAEDGARARGRSEAGASGARPGGPVRRRARVAPPLLEVTVADPLVVGRLSVASDGSSSGISLWYGGLRERELNLPEPLGRVSGKLVMTASGRRDKSALQAHVSALVRDLLISAPKQRALLPPLGGHREKLDHLIAYMRERVGPRDDYGLAAALGLSSVEERAEREAKLRRLSLSAAPLRPLPTNRVALLERVVVQSLAMALAPGTAMLSWRAAKLGKRRRDGTIEVDFGLRNGWIQSALDEDRQLDMDAHRRAALLAGALVIAEFFYQAREREDLILTTEHLSVALWRLLQLR